MLNSIAIQGRLVHTPEAKVTKSGKDVCAFSIACDHQSGSQRKPISSTAPHLVIRHYSFPSGFRRVA